MEVSLNLLNKYVKIDDQDPKELADKITSIGLEVEGMHSLANGNNMTIGYVKECIDHPDSDHLHVCQVEVRPGEVTQIVCGAPNVAAGQKVIVANPGCDLGEGFVIKQSTIRGQESNGMICSMAELGPAVVETFGEVPFEPVNKKQALHLNERQQKLRVGFQNEAGQIVNRYIKDDEYGYTIIAYPMPEIDPRYEKIFREIVKINTLDYEKYQRIQQYLIDALDEGVSVHVLGKGENRTDLRVMLHHLNDPAKETNFENCVADCNIPVGEVFTSPSLTGTTGVLHVTGVYLNELYYRDLCLTLTDGMITAYDCANFEKEEDNRTYIEENLLYHHRTLPIGEFAIGTNTTAYVMAEQYGIAGKLPILIAEKMGPHFAMGDTCYAWAEDSPMYNPDGKEVIARENEVSAKRKEDPSKAYFGCHTDITIPYRELQSVAVEKADGTTIPLIEDGRFVLPGTEELNEPFG